MVDYVGRRWHGVCSPVPAVLQLAKDLAFFAMSCLTPSIRMESSGNTSAVACAPIFFCHFPLHIRTSALYSSRVRLSIVVPCEAQHELDAVTDAA